MATLGPDRGAVGNRGSGVEPLRGGRANRAERVRLLGLLLLDPGGSLLDAPTREEWIKRWHAGLEAFFFFFWSMGIFVGIL